MTEKKTYAAPQLKVHQIKTESVILEGSPEGQTEKFQEGSTDDWFEDTEG